MLGKGGEVKTLLWSMFVIILTAVMVHAGPAIAAPPAAPLNFCNRTSAPVGVAYGYYSSGVDDGQNHNLLTDATVWCQEDGRRWTVANVKSFANPFSARYMFWFPIEPHQPRSHTVVEDSTGPGTHHVHHGRWFHVRRSKRFNRCMSQRSRGDERGREMGVVDKVGTEVDPNVSFTGYNY